MSIMSQMQSIASDKNIDTQDYLIRLYNNVKNQTANDLYFEDEKLKARKLEIFLRLVKDMQNNKGQISDETAVSEEFWDIVEQKTLVNALNDVTGGKLINENLLNFKSNNIFKQGDALERGIAQIVKAIQVLHKENAQDLYEEDISIQSKTGMFQTQVVDLIDIVDQKAKKTLNKFYNKTYQELKKHPNKKMVMTKVFGKIDNYGISADIKIEATSQIEKDIIDCLRDATFTDKNYGSNKDILLGQTNPFRVYMTLGNGRQHYNRWHRMFNCFELHYSTGFKHLEAPSYFYRLRAIYELTGFNMKYFSSRNQELANRLTGAGHAKYLIWNTPGSDSIRVIPTSLIVANILNSENFINNNIKENLNQAIYGPIYIKQSSLKDI